ncbi:auxin-responsive protein IAA31-like [Carex rostrata]
MEVATEANFVHDMDNLKATELRLGLPGSDEPEKPTVVPTRGNKRSLEQTDEPCQATTDSTKPNKAQVVGWPPIRAYRKNNFHTRNINTKTEAEAGTGGLFVKVSMDGAPYLRKVDLTLYKCYKELREALEALFKCFSLEMDGCGAADFAITYEDKDGDLMLVGDVPWEMFINNCRRLRIMRGSEARGLASSQ